MPETNELSRPNFHAVKVIGHRSPDTDSICAAIAYSRLKNAVDPARSYKPCRAGQLNRETQFVLERFGAEPPQLYADVSAQVRDVDIRLAEGVDGGMSLRQAWERMRDQSLDTLCVVDGENRLQGLITLKDVATANMDGVDPYVLAQAETSYENVIETIGGTVLVGDPAGKTVQGRIIIGAGNSEMMERAIKKGDVVIVSNRSESQLTAIEMEAGCIVVGMDSKVSKTIRMLAEENDCLIISTPLNTYATGQIIPQAAPIRYYMLKDGLMTFDLNTSVEAATKIMGSVRHRYFPVLGDDGKYLGVVSRRNLLNLHKKQLILVDHNEKAQAAEGLEDAEVLEIIDHHRIGALETDNPVYFRNMPVGCTCTIICQMYEEAGVAIDAQTAGLMLSAILSDTLMFRSPTCTPLDERAARRLAELAGVDLEAYADEMFEHGGDISGETPEQIFATDYKVFASGRFHFGVGQGSYMSEKNRRAAEALVGPYLETARVKQGLDFVFYLFTDVRGAFSEVLMAGEGAEQAIARAFGVAAAERAATLPGVLSRKKQFVPALIDTLKHEGNA
ncbi:MAG: putative manganese-dependent inorganic diphosphatase [Oscillospiraceae bacterium]|nr:putative manganese-dependent inorganic diphosphatase [Oscillospiraceae bacterium]